MKVDIWTGDSDPVYWAVARAANDWGYEWATRFSVAMIAFYHTGLAIQAAEYKDAEFWLHLEGMYPSAPRGSERRHFRGDKGWVALQDMKKFAPNPVYFFEKMGKTYAEVSKTCDRFLSQCGPYFQLKICDYMDRCLGLRILDYSGLENNLPTEPHRAVETMFPGHKVPNAFMNLVVEMQKGELFAPPHFDRLVTAAEVETSLCGWKTTKYKGNWFGADILDKRKALVGWGDQALEFMKFFPEPISKGLFKIELE